MKSKIINKIKIVLGCIGTVGGSLALLLGVLLQSPLLILLFVLTIPSIMLANNGVSNNYVTNSIFEVHRNFSHIKDNGEQEKVDLINQKFISLAPLEMKILNSDSVVKREINKRKKEFNELLRVNGLKGEEKEKLIEEFHNKNIDMMKSYKFAMGNLISTYYQVQMLNLFSQLKMVDEDGNDITYFLCSHGVTINYLESACMDGKDDKSKKYFIKNMQKGNPTEHNIARLKFLMGNFKFKQLFNKKRLKRKVKMYDVTFKLTGEKLALEDIPNMIRKDELYCFDVISNKDGCIILKLNKDKVISYQENILKMFMTNSIQGEGVSILNDTLLNYYDSNKDEKKEDNADFDLVRKRALLFELKNMLNKVREENSDSLNDEVSFKR